MLPKDAVRHWGPIPQFRNYLSSLIPEGASVLELGPGNVPFHRSTHFVESCLSEHLPHDMITVCDVMREPLPFPDKSFDFVYTRHMIEDLVWPELILNEMSRVGKAGCIETPSALAEFVRGVDGNLHGWHGYAHHMWYVWGHKGVLKLMKKMPMMEHLNFGDEKPFEELLTRSEYMWNTYFLWKDEIRWESHHCIPYSGNEKRVLDAVTESVDDVQRFLMGMAEGRNMLEDPPV